MKDKELQRKLWTEDDHHEDLPKLLAAIRASEAASDGQATCGSESGSAVSLKCHKCGKWGHSKKDCRSTEDKTSSSKCGFCGGNEKCRMKKCKAYNTKCNKCNMFGHFKACCTDFTKARARTDRDKAAISQVETDRVETNNANSIRLMAVRREEKKMMQQKTRKAEDNNVNKVIENESKHADVTNSEADVINQANSENVASEDVNNDKAANHHVIRINHVASHSFQTASAVVWCPKVGKFVQKASKNYVPLRMEVETLHEVNLENKDGGLKQPKVPVLKNDKRTANLP